MEGFGECWEKTSTYQRCGNTIAAKGSRVKKLRDDAEKERQEGIQGQWHHESPARECLEQVKCCNDTDCTPRMMKQAFLALKGGDWEEYKSIFGTEVNATGWAFDRIQEAFEKVAKDEARNLTTDQEIMIRSTDYLRRTIAPAGCKEALRCHTCARIATVSQWKTSGRAQRRKSTQICGVRSVEKNMIGGRQTGCWCCKQAKVSTRRRSSECTRYLKACVVINALKLLPNQQVDGDGPVQSIAT